MFYWMFYIIMKCIDLVYFRTKYIGKEHFPESGKFIIACNHISNLDPFVMGICDRRRFNFLAKEELFKNKFLGWCFRQMGSIPIKRSAMDKQAMRNCLQALERNPLILFPEGTRGTADRVKKPNPGAGFLAVKSGVPVVPTYIEGTLGALPNGAKWFKFHPVTVTFGQPLHFDKSKSYEEISGEILKEIYKLK